MHPEPASNGGSRLTPTPSLKPPTYVTPPKNSTPKNSSLARKKMKKEQSVKDYIQRAISLHNFILERYPNGTYKSDRRNTLFVSLCDLALEHFGAIISLIKSGQHTGSAFALMRPLIETSVRAYWVRYIANDGIASQHPEMRSGLSRYETGR
jgi:hypothetical protein